MYFPDNIFVIIVLTVCFVFVRCQRGRERGPFQPIDYEDEEKPEELLPEDYYSFVALIDIVFPNGEKKTCTGTIIHDNVVITAAHCFDLLDKGDILKPEVTASFVVIGTKKLFEAGYEQYLPIERILVHPKYEGWNADLALVFTFAGMMSDKPGVIVPLAIDKTSAPVDSEATVFSWGQCKEDTIKLTTRPKKKITPPRDERDEPTSEVGGHEEVPEEGKGAENEWTEKPDNPEIKRSEELERENQKTERQRRKKRKHHERHRQKIDIPVTRARGRTWAARLNEYTVPSSNEENNHYTDGQHGQHRYENMSDFDSEADHRTWDLRTLSQDKLDKLYKKTKVNKKRLLQKDRRQVSYYRNNWRRKMGDQQNKLTVVIFSFVHTQRCLQFINRAMPSSNVIKNSNELVCYANVDRYITEEDSGAPVMRRGRLIAVTVGNVELDGDHIALGMKMTCFCNWIADNLPQTGRKIQCCRNCCDDKAEDLKPKEPPFRNTYSRRR